MRPVGALIAILIALVMVLAGCLQIPDSIDDADESDTQASDGSDDAQDDAQQPDPGAPPEDGNGQNDDGDDGNGDNDNGSNGDDGNGGNAGNGNETRAECHEHDPPRPAAPHEQQVVSENDLRCPGQYVILDEGTGEAWEVPTWTIGDWWHYEIRALASCQGQQRASVAHDDQSVNGVPVYVMKYDHYDCNGEPGEPGQRQQGSGPPNRTRDSLAEINNEGTVQHGILFPLREGKSWKYVIGCTSDGCIIAGTDEVSHKPNHLHGLESKEAWYVETSFTANNHKITYKTWWGVEAENILERVEDYGAVSITRSLVDSSNNGGGSGGIGLLPLP